MVKLKLNKGKFKGDEIIFTLKKDWEGDVDLKIKNKGKTGEFFALTFHQNGSITKLGHISDELGFKLDKKEQLIIKSKNEKKIR